jgi:DNA-binding beta-propeller fold protein YncE
VFDANQPGSGLGGEPLTIVQLFSDKPGALAASPDGKDVFVTVFTSGNQTTVIDRFGVCGNGTENRDTRVSRGSDGPCQLATGAMAPGGTPAPNANTADGTPNPSISLIVQFDPATGAWRDVLGRDFREVVAFELPDNDVFVLDAMASPPREKAVFRGVGTLNKRVAIDPKSGKAFVANIEAINTNRFLSVPRVGAFPNPMPAPVPWLICWA